MIHDQAKVPDGWRMVRLGDVADVNRSNWDPVDSSSILYLDLTAVAAPGRLSDPMELAANNAPSRARRRVRSGDVLVSTVRPYLRGFARVKEAPSNLVASTGFAVLTPTNRINDSFVFHHVMTYSFARYLERAMTGQAYPAVRPADVAAYSLPLPPLPEQQAIATVLDSVDEAIERTERVIVATERLRDALLHELLTRGLPGKHSEFKQEPGIGTIPASWRVVRLGDVADVNRRNWDPTDGSSILYLDLTAIVAPGQLSAPKEIAARDAPSRARRRVRSGDVLVSTVRPNLRGFARVRQAPANLIASTGFAVLTPLADVDGSFVYHHVMTHWFARYLENATTGQAYPAVRPADVVAYVLPRPPLTEQQVIAVVLDTVAEAIEREQTRRDALQSLKSAASEALLTGKVQMP